MHHPDNKIWNPVHKVHYSSSIGILNFVTWKVGSIRLLEVFEVLANEPHLSKGYSCPHLQKLEDALNY